MYIHPKVDLKKELKLRLFYVFFAFLLSALAAYNQRDLLFYFLLKPLVQNSEISLNASLDGMLFFKITEALQAQLYLSLIVGVFISLPTLWLQLWLFFAPALYVKEQKLFFQLIISSLSFIFGGILFATKVFIPRIWKFFLSFGALNNPNCIEVAKEENFALVNDWQYLPSIIPYLEFSFEIFFAILVSSQVPLLLFLALHNNWVSKESLVKKRPFIILFFLVWAALLSPPDLMSQIIIFVPLFFSYEFLILLLFWQRAFQKLLFRTSNFSCL